MHTNRPWEEDASRPSRTKRSSQALGSATAASSYGLEGRSSPHGERSSSRTSASTNNYSSSSYERYLAQKKLQQNEEVARQQAIAMGNIESPYDPYDRSSISKKEKKAKKERKERKSSRSSEGTLHRPISVDEADLRHSSRRSQDGSSSKGHEHRAPDVSSSSSGGLSAAAQSLRSMSIDLSDPSSSAALRIGRSSVSSSFRGVEKFGSGAPPRPDVAKELRTRRVAQQQQQRRGPIASADVGETEKKDSRSGQPSATGASDSWAASARSNYVLADPAPTALAPPSSYSNKQNLDAKFKAVEDQSPSSDRPPLSQAGWSTLRRNPSDKSLPIGAPLTQSTEPSLQTKKPNQDTRKLSASKGSVASERAFNEEDDVRSSYTNISHTSKVDEYLASRTKDIQRQQELVTSTQQRVSSKSPPRATAGNNLGLLRLVPSTDESSSDDESLDDDDINEEETDSDDEQSGAHWSVRVCVVSGVDFPSTVVPNLPLSPVLKVGLVKLPGVPTDGKSKGSTKEVSETLERDGLSSFRNAKVRTTSPKVLSKRDNGAVEFHEEMRWDHISHPHQMALAIEFSARAVLTPANARESPLLPRELNGAAPSPGADTSRFGRGLFRGNQRGQTEMEQAHAAAAVAKLLVEDDNENPGAAATPAVPERGNLSRASSSSGSKSGSGQREKNVKLRPKRKRRKACMTEDLRLGSRIVVLDSLPLERAMKKKESVRIEQWFELEASTASLKPSSGKSSGKRNPSVLLEISFAEGEVLDDSEDDMEELDDASAGLRASFSKRASIKIRNQLKREGASAEKKIEEPVLHPALIDFACVVGARDIGDQKQDEGARGWVNTRPECVLLERFPQTDEFHASNGRMIALGEKIEWFCFPEGVKLWRGTTPPNAEEMNLKRFSAASPSLISTATALFDAYLGCTTSFSWFVIASNSEEYGSETMKTYGAVIRFYVPAPVGIDTTQDDFAQFLHSGTVNRTGPTDSKRLWVPLALCVISSLPIIGVMESMLLRLCEGFSDNGVFPSSVVLEDLANMVVNFQRPIPGVVNCSVPFLNGDRYLIGLPPKQGLPPLPHGNVVSSVCRLLGPEGFNFLLAALLTESKILLHSDDVSNLCMVAEVMTALIFPFQWSLPFVPVLPLGMMEFIEAPLSYLLGVPSCNMKFVDPSVLLDVLVIDLDQENAVSSLTKQVQSGERAFCPLPATASSNISRAVGKLIISENQEDHDMATMGKESPRLEPETVIEREFRLSILVEICGLIRGLKDCLVYASSAPPVFDENKFLQTAPSLFEGQRGKASSSGSNSSGDARSQRVISPRSRRFLSQLVHCQHFHQFIETINHESMFLYHEVTSILNARIARRDPTMAGKLLSLDNDNTINRLSKLLTKMEDSIPTFHVTRPGEKELVVGETPRPDSAVKFPFDLLQQIAIDDTPAETGGNEETGVKQISLAYLVELEKNPWRYHRLFDLGSSKDEIGESNAFICAAKRVKLRDAIGDRNYRAWQVAQIQGGFDSEDIAVLPDNCSGQSGNAALNLTSFISSAAEEIKMGSQETNKTGTHAAESVESAKSRDIIRRCLEHVRLSGDAACDSSQGNGRNSIAEAEKALCNHAARRFLLSILGKRASLAKTEERSPRSAQSPNASKLTAETFDVLVRLSFAMLDFCVEQEDFECAYTLLRLTAGLYTTSSEINETSTLFYLTERIGLHIAYSDLRLWEMVMRTHVLARQQSRKDDSDEARSKTSTKGTDEYEATIGTLYEMAGYGIPPEELVRFATQIGVKKSWFKSEKGHSLLMLARRLCVRSELTGQASTCAKQMSDIDAIRTLPSQRLGTSNKATSGIADGEGQWIVTCWCHPAATSSRRASLGDISKRTGTQSLLNMLDEQKGVQPKTERRMKRSPVTAMTYVGLTMVATGGLDGGVFLARRVAAADETAEDDGFEVKGLHLDWGSSGSRYTSGGANASTDGEYGVGAVSCLATTHGHGRSLNLNPRCDVGTAPLDDDDLVKSMDGSRVIAGTTSGDLRVWNVKDVLASVLYQSEHERSGSSGQRRAGTDYSAGSSMTRLKLSIRGRALSGHRGGVSCIDVPSNVYRPDSVVSGGADGLIKLWILRTPGGGTSAETECSSRFLHSPGGDSQQGRAARNGDALSILSGHGGRILCIKTAWHGDRLISGGADRIVRVWDLAVSGGKCLTSLSGHFGWVSAVRYWGPHTIISASTDRSIALWDSRIRKSPIFALRHHSAPVSDLLVGSRTDPLMVSAGMDGSVACWDFRQLAGNERMDAIGRTDLENRDYRKCYVSRGPLHSLKLPKVRGPSTTHPSCGLTLLSSGYKHQNSKTVYCTGNDAILREWDVVNGSVVKQYTTGHCDLISSIKSLEGDIVRGNQLQSTSGTERPTSTITASWDGTVRLRTFVRKN